MRLIQKKESKSERMTTYSKRSKGLLKKVYELSVLCDVDVGLLMFAPNGKLRHYSNQPRIENVLQEFIQSIPNMPEKKREKFASLQTSQDIIDLINTAAGPDDMADQQGSDAPQREEVNREIIELQNKLMLLQEQEKMLDPTMGTLNSAQERKEHINRLWENALIMIAKRKGQLMSQQGLTPCTGPSLSVQNVRTQLPIQQLQAVIEAAIWGPQQGGEQLQLHGLPVVEMGDPSSSLDIIEKILMEQPQSGIEAGMWGPQQGGEQQQLQSAPLVPIGDPSRSSFWVLPPQAGTGAGMWVPPQGGEQVQLPAVPGFEMGYPSSSSVPLYTGEQMVNPLQYSQQQQHGMAFSVGEQPSSTFWSQPGGAALSDEELEFVASLLS